jgi:hypothetical protein
MRRVNLGGSHRILYGEAPFGWRLSTDRSKLVRDPDEQQLMSAVRRMYLAGLPMRGIVDRLRSMGALNRRGRPFGIGSVWEMIHGRNKQPAEAKPVVKKGPKRAKRAARVAR